MLWTDLERAVCAVKVQKFFQASVQDSSTEVRNFDIIAAAQGVTLDNESKDPHVAKRIELKSSKCVYFSTAFS